MSATSAVWFDEGLRLVRLQYVGPVSLAALLAGAHEAIQLVLSHGVSETLADFSQATTELRTSEIFELPQTFEALARQQGLAMQKFRQHVVMAEAWRDFDFFANVSNNRGQRAVLYRSLEEALVALRSEGSHCR